MSRTLTRFLLAMSSVLAFAFLLTPAGPLGARGRGPSSLQPDSSAVIFTMVLQRNEPVSHGNYLILPSPNGHASPYAKNSNSSGGGGHKGGGSSGGGTSGGGSGTSSSCCGVLKWSFSTGSSYAPGVVQTPNTATQPEAEEEIAADPNNSLNLVAAISDFSSSSGYNNTRWDLSNDGGTTWTANFVPTDSSGLLVTNDGTWDANSDPVVAIDSNHNVYLSDLYLNVDSYGRITGEGLYVSVATFDNLGGTSGTPGNFSNTYPVLTNLRNGKTFNIEDKPWITVDNSGGPNKGTVYATWSHFTGCQNQGNAFTGYVLTCSSDFIDFSYSKNQGKTWSTPVQISPSTQDGAVQGSQPAVGPDGTVYVAYEFFGSNNQRVQYLAVSSGGVSTNDLSFSTPFTVSPVFNELTFAGCSTCSVTYRVNSFPNIAVGAGSSAAGNVYLVYGAQDSSGTAHVNFVACTSNCTTSSSFDGPAVLDDNAAGDHFFPAISVDPAGTINTSWFDTRLGPTADYLDVFGSFLTYDSSTNSFTISPNARVTQTTDDASYGNIGFGDTSFIGDYIGIAATPGSAHPVWTDASGILGIPIVGSLQTSTLTLPDGTP